MNSDLSLVAQVVASDDRRAFDELVRRYQSPVRRFFLNQTLGDGQLSDDLAQDTFLKAYVNMASFRGQAAFQTWLMRIAYNVFYDYTRKRGHSPTGKETDIDERTDYMLTPGPSAYTPELKMDIYSALALLKTEERLCITLQLIDGYDIAKIAEITGMKDGTVRSHLSRGKGKVANYLKKNGYGRR